MVLDVHAIAVGFHLPSGFFVFAFCWGWVAFAALFDRLDAARDMSATLTGLLLLMPPFIELTPLGGGETKAFYSLAWFPSLIGSVCVLAYVHHIQRKESLPNVSFGDLIADMSLPVAQQDSEARALAAEEFSRSITESAAQQDQHTAPASAPSRRFTASSN